MILSWCVGFAHCQQGIFNGVKERRQRASQCVADQEVFLLATTVKGNLEEAREAFEARKREKGLTRGFDDLFLEVFFQNASSKMCDGWEQAIEKNRQMGKRNKHLGCIGEESQSKDQSRRDMDGETRFERKRG